MKNSCHSSNITKNIQVRIVSNIKISSNYYKITLSIGRLSSTVKPGHFFNVKCNDGIVPLLRRPFSVHKLRSTGDIDILYEIIGDATTLLSKKKKGDILDILGPLGNGFDLKPYTMPACRQAGNHTPYTILVAGGMGIAPLVALAEALSRKDGYKAVIIGTKTEADILCERDFAKSGFEISVATEDGSKGKKALATDLLKDLLRNTKYERRTTVYACGPNPMLKEIAKIARAKKITAYGSFEEHMACGVGSCYGCVIKTKDGYKRVCKEGPVFDLREIIW